MWTIRRWGAVVLALSIWEADPRLRADEAAEKTTDAPIARPSDKLEAKKADSPSIDQTEQPAKKKNGIATQEKQDSGKKDSRKGDPSKKAASPNLDLKVLAVPLNVLIGGVVNGQAQEGVLLKQNELDAIDPNDVMRKQTLQQLRPVYASELGFTRLVLSDLTVEQRQKIKAPAYAALKEAARRISDQQNQRRRVGLQETNKVSVPRVAIRQAILKAVKETVSDEQRSRYEAELLVRLDRRKKTAILSLVSLMDQQMLLTQEQRSAITEAISAKWQDDWESWTRMSQTYGDRYFPQVPNALVLPHLNAAQKTVWMSVQKIDLGWWWGGEQGVDPDEDGWWGPDEPTDEVGPKNAVKRWPINKGILEIFSR